jgi:cytidine deaminase
MQILIDEARRAAANAYCPHSRFPVGAALLAEDGRVFTGVNAENGSYGLTWCAERAAFAAAITAGARRFTAMAVVGRGAPTPCGACRQVMAEFCKPDFQVIAAPLDGQAPATTFSLAELLPHAFALKPQTS